MAISEARKRANRKWNEAHMKERYDRIQLVAPAGEKAAFEAAAQKANAKSLNAYILGAVREKMERERTKIP